MKPEEILEPARTAHSVEIGERLVTDSMFAGIVAFNDLSLQLSSDGEGEHGGGQYDQPIHTKDLTQNRIKDSERCLTEVEHLNRFRNLDDSHSEWAVNGVRENLITAIKEAAMPYAISPVYQEYREGTFWWLDQTPEEVAASGFRYHQHPAALARVKVEVDDAIDTNENLRPGMIKVFLSPRMSTIDAPYKIAQQEHLGDDDAIRIQQLDIQDGQVQGKIMQSILVRHIPLDAWAAMLKDPDNIFGKSLELEDETSALSIMKTHRELHLPASMLPEGVLSVLDAVLPYVDDEHYESIARQLAIFRETNQGDLHEKAENIADRWLQFEKDLADSLYTGYASQNIHQFIHSLSGQWSKEVVYHLEQNTTVSGDIHMTRELATMLEAGRQSTLWAAAAVITNNDKVIEQLNPEIVQHIYNEEMRLQTLVRAGYDAEEMMMLEAQINQTIARHHIRVGGGCPGTTKDMFGSEDEDDENSAKSSGTSPEDQRNWKTKRGVCVVPGCPTRPDETTVGPCGVCMGRCQKVFNAGGNPVKSKRSDFALAA